MIITINAGLLQGDVKYYAVYIIVPWWIYTIYSTNFNIFIISN